ncbi:MAG: type II toxin-antitoxin system HicB family antitoxin [Spirochaetia bacterium]|nr:type II toxin-antitoxin system HicB family antitoxin [Spirochaetia bacterium]
MEYLVQLEKNEEGYSVSCPGLPGCWSQGNTKEESLENIKDAIHAYNETIKEITKNKDTYFVKVTI